MAGILDKKSRFIDFVVTSEGRRQIADGKLRAEFISLSDMNAFYDKSESTKEAGDRIYFQAMERPENAIVMEKDDSGKLLYFDFSPTGSIVGEAIFNKEATGEDLRKYTVATGSQFASTSKSLEKAFLRHFERNYFLGTNFAEQDNNEFIVSDKLIIYKITQKTPFLKGPQREVINVNDAEPFLLDPKLTHLPNFEYLPPVNENGSAYGNYKDLRNMTKVTYRDIIKKIGDTAFKVEQLDVSEKSNIRIDKIGDIKLKEPIYTTNVTKYVKKEFKTINFLKTSYDNNLLIQMFEKDKNRIKKLDIIDAGIFNVDDENNRNEKHIFYVGKIYIDDFGTPTFINLFTIIFD
mgnify:CR=1 FL=1|tara:strand:+ start:447 stop:1493 length:1047 start_codon:yes stop_codon:yes gene_type:complete